MPVLAQLLVHRREVRRRARRIPLHQACLRAREQRRLYPLLVPALRQRPIQARRLGSLQLLVNCACPGRAASPDLLATRFEFVSEAQHLPDLPHRQSPGRHSVPPLGGSLCRDNVQRRPPVEIVPGHRECHSGIARNPFAFPPESPFTFSPESRSPSARNDVHVHPGTAFTFARNPQHPAGRGRTPLLRLAGSPSKGRVTRINQPPVKPARFIAFGIPYEL